MGGTPQSDAKKTIRAVCSAIRRESYLERANFLFGAAMDAGKFRFGPTSTLTVGACVALASRLDKSNERLGEIAVCTKRAMLRVSGAG